MGFGSFMRTAAANLGKAIKSAAHVGAAAARTGAGIAWANRWEILDFAVSGAAVGASLATGGWTLGLAGAKLAQSSLQLGESLAATAGKHVDPLFKQARKAKKRARDANDGVKAGAMSVGTEDKKPRVSGDMRARMANLASMR